MDSEVFGAIIEATATIVAAVIGGWVAIKIKEMELITKSNSPSPSVWIWGIVGAILGIFLALAFFRFTSNPTTIPQINSYNTSSRVSLPQIVTDLLDGVEVLDIDTFDTLDNWYKWNPQSGSLSDGIFILVGQPGHMGGITFRRRFVPGQGVMLRYRLETNRDFFSEFVLATGPHMDDGSLMFGVYNGQNPKSNLYQGANGLGGYDLPGTLITERNTWYNLLMAVNENGELLAIVWNPNDLSEYVIHRVRMGSRWDEKSWEFTAKANDGETVYIDDFYEIAFTNFNNSFFDK